MMIFLMQNIKIQCKGFLMKEKRISYLSVLLTPELKEEKGLYDFSNHHKMIWELWGDRENIPFLYRIKNNTLFVLSKEDFENSPEWLDEKFVRRNVPMSVKPGIYCYDVVVNPTKMVNHKRIPLTRNGDILKWWERKALNMGCRLNCDVVIKDKKKEKSSSRNITIFTANLQGIVEIVDSEKFTNIMLNGIGPAKRFGCGLMQIYK
jgi:CRISPR-associated protein Cas6/Cse3/CasE subtype I-E